MSEEGQTSMLSYAEFLAVRHPTKHTATAPLDIMRPAQESVVAALRRLSRTYPMLDKQTLLHETSSFVTQHIMHGREAAEIIDEMEIYFRQQYQQFNLRNGNDSDA